MLYFPGKQELHFCIMQIERLREEQEVQRQDCQGVNLFCKRGTRAMFFFLLSMTVCYLLSNYRIL